MNLRGLILLILRYVMPVSMAVCYPNRIFGAYLGDVLLAYNPYASTGVADCEATCTNVPTADCEGFHYDSSTMECWFYAGFDAWTEAPASHISYFPDDCSVAPQCYSLLIDESPDEGNSGSTSPVNVAGCLAFCSANGACAAVKLRHPDDTCYRKPGTGISISEDIGRSYFRKVSCPIEAIDVCVATQPHFMVGGWCFAVQSSPGETWAEAKAACEADAGGFLAALPHAGLVANLALHDMPPVSRAWVSLVQAAGGAEPGGGWEWVLPDASKVPFTGAWYPLEPNNNGGGEGLGLARSESGSFGFDDDNDVVQRGHRICAAPFPAAGTGCYNSIVLGGYHNQPNIVGADNLEGDGDYAANCADLCVSYADCTNFVTNPSSGNCWLKNGPTLDWVDLPVYNNYQPTNCSTPTTCYTAVEGFLQTGTALTSFPNRTISFCLEQCSLFPACVAVLYAYAGTRDCQLQSDLTSPPLPSPAVSFYLKADCAMSSSAAPITTTVPISGDATITACLEAPHLMVAGRCYSRLNGSGSYADAKGSCEAGGGSLAALPFPGLVANIKKDLLTEDPTRLWVALEQDAGGAEPAGGWEWRLPDNTKVPFALPWKPAEPDDSGGTEDHGALVLVSGVDGFVDAPEGFAVPGRLCSAAYPEAGTHCFDSVLINGYHLQTAYYWHSGAGLVADGDAIANCADLCGSYADCTSFTYMPSTQQCWPKQGYTDEFVLYLDGHQFFPTNCSTPRVCYEGKSKEYYFGNIILSLSSQKLADCLEECSIRPDCVSVSYNFGATRNCKLRSTKDGLGSSNSIDGYVRVDCPVSTTSTTSTTTTSAPFSGLAACLADPNHVVNERYCYAGLYGTRRSQAGAEGDCAARGGHLAVIPDNGTLDAIVTDLLPLVAVSPYGLWLGIEQLDPGNVTEGFYWQHPDGTTTPIDIAMWNPGQPNDLDYVENGEENRASLDQSSELLGDKKTANGREVLCMYQLGPDVCPYAVYPTSAVSGLALERTYKLRSGESVQECKEVCDSIDDCDGFNYVPSDGLCNLLTGDVTSGVIGTGDFDSHIYARSNSACTQNSTRCAWRVFPSYTRFDGAYNEIGGQSRGSCLDLCVANPACVGISFRYTAPTKCRPHTDAGVYANDGSAWSAYDARICTQTSTTSPAPTAAAATTRAPLSFADCLAAAGAIPYNGDCFLTRVPSVATSEGRRAACAPDSHMAVLHWKQGLIDVGAFLTVGAFVSLHQEAGATQLDEGWYWELADSRIIPMHPTSQFWDGSDPNDVNGTESGDENVAAVRTIGKLVDIRENSTWVDVLCQFPGPRTFAEFDYDWCMGSGAMFTSGGACYAAVKKYVVTAEEAFSSCGDGTLATLHTQALLNASVTLLDMNGDGVYIVALRQAANATAVDTEWWWEMADGSTVAMKPSFWWNNYPTDNQWNYDLEDGERNYAGTYATSPGIKDLPLIHGNRAYYPLCRFEGPPLTFSDCVAGGGFEYNGDCFIARVAGFPNEAGRRSLCAGGALAALFWPAAAPAVAAGIGPSTRIFISLYQDPSATTVDTKWLWELGDGTRVKARNEYIPWLAGQPNDGAGGYVEDGGENWGSVRPDGTLNDVSDDYDVPTLCQYRGPHNYSEFDYDWCMGSGSMFTVGGACYAAVKKYVVNAEEAFSSCGNGTLATLETQELVDAAGALLVANSDSLYVVALRQQPNTTAPTSVWWWDMPDGSTPVFDASNWMADHPRDVAWTPDVEDNERNHGAVYSPGQFIDIPLTHDYWTFYPLCRFEEALSACFVSNTHIVEDEWCYWIETGAGHTKTQAQSECENYIGGFLAPIITTTLQTWTSGAVWVALEQAVGGAEPAGGWEWILPNNSRVPFTGSWAGSDPNDGGGADEDFAFYDTTIGGFADVGVARIETSWVCTAAVPGCYRREAPFTYGSAYVSNAGTGTVAACLEACEANTACGNVNFHEDTGQCNLVATPTLADRNPAISAYSTFTKCPCYDTVIRGGYLAGSPGEYSVDASINNTESCGLLCSLRTTPEICATFALNDAGCHGMGFTLTHTTAEPSTSQYLPSVCGEELVCFRLVKDTTIGDAAGLTISSNSDTLLDCAAACRSNSTCAGFVFAWPGCLLKSGALPELVSGGTDSFVVEPCEETTTLAPTTSAAIESPTTTTVALLATTSDSSCGFRVENGTYPDGWNSLQLVPLHNDSEIYICLELCASQPACVWVRYNNWHGTCWLKSSSDPLLNGTQAYFEEYVPVQANCHQESDHCPFVESLARVGPMLANLTDVRLNDCAAACEADAACAQYSYHWLDHACLTFGAIGAPIPSPADTTYFASSPCAVPAAPCPYSMHFGQVSTGSELGVMPLYPAGLAECLRACDSLPACRSVIVSYEDICILKSGDASTALPYATTARLWTRDNVTCAQSFDTCFPEIRIYIDYSTTSEIVQNVTGIIFADCIVACESSPLCQAVSYTVIMCPKTTSSTSSTTTTTSSTTTTTSSTTTTTSSTTTTTSSTTTSTTTSTQPPTTSTVSTTTSTSTYSTSTSSTMTSASSTKRSITSTSTSSSTSSTIMSTSSISTSRSSTTTPSTTTTSTSSLAGTTTPTTIISSTAIASSTDAQLSTIASTSSTKLGNIATSTALSSARAKSTTTNDPSITSIELSYSVNALSISSFVTTTLVSTPLSTSKSTSSALLSSSASTSAIISSSKSTTSTTTPTSTEIPTLSSKTTPSSSSMLPSSTISTSTTTSTQTTSNMPTTTSSSTMKPSVMSTLSLSTQIYTTSTIPGPNQSQTTVHVSAVKSSIATNSQAQTSQSPATMTSLAATGQPSTKISTQSPNEIEPITNTSTPYSHSTSHLEATSTSIPRTSISSTISPSNEEFSSSSTKDSATSWPTMETSEIDLTTYDDASLTPTSRGDSSSQESTIIEDTVTTTQFEVTTTRAYETTSESEVFSSAETESTFSGDGLSSSTNSESSSAASSSTTTLATALVKSTAKSKQTSNVVEEESIPSSTTSFTSTTEHSNTDGRTSGESPKSQSSSSPTAIESSITPDLKTSEPSALDEATIDAIEAYAGQSLPTTIAEAIAAGNDSALTSWLADLEPQPSDAALETFKAADTPGLTTQVKDAINNWHEDRFQQSESDTTTGSSVTSNQPSPLAKATIDAIEAYAGKSLPPGIAEAIAAGNDSALTSWLAELEPQPLDAALDIFKSADTPGLTTQVKDAINSWHEDQLQPSEKSKLETVLGEEIPADILGQVETGDPEALITWMADNGVLPTDSEWDDADLPNQPPKIQEALDNYRERQKELTALATLSAANMTHIPDSAKKSLLANGDPTELMNWLRDTKQDPDPAVWELLESNPSLSNATKIALAQLRTDLEELSCHGTWLEWSQWTSCPVTCGRGNRTRERRRQMEGCPLGTEILYCGLKFCETDCEWSAWATWGSCSASCGAGSATRYRKHATKASEYGLKCTGPNVESHNCTGDVCVDPTVPPEVLSNLEQAGIDPDTASEPAAFAAAATDTIPFYLAQLTLEEKMAMGHSLQDTVPLCSFNGRRCPIDDFKTYYDEALGNCFTFNHQMPAKYLVERPGAQSGLKILLQSQQGEYICSSQIAGFKLIIHNQTERPFADTMGFNVAPGKTTSISVSQLETKKQPPPYGDCTELKNEEFLYNGTHTIEGCLRSCYQKQLTSLCKCADPRYTTPNSAKPCGLDKKLCLDYYRNCVEEEVSGSDSPMSCKQCTNPCESYLYLMTTSTGEMLDTKLLSGMCGISQSDSVSSSCGSSEDNQNNFAMVQIYYERLNLMRFTEVPDYEMANLISDFAGVLGITMGASVLSMFEFVYAVVAMIIHLVSKQTSSILA